MAKTMYDKCKELIESKFKPGDEIGMVRLSTQIMLHIGGQQRTISENVKLMLQTKLIKDIGNMHFRIL